jgi:hypothetical protein
MLALGCSHTFGNGLPEDQTWVAVLAKKINLDFSNLAQGGESTITQIIRAFYYFEKFGNPQIIVALFPMFRMPSVYVENRMAKSSISHSNFNKGRSYMPLIEDNIIHNENFEFYSKAPYSPEKIFTEEMSFFYESVFIDILRQYCKTNNISLVWSNWNEDYQRVIYNKINEFYLEHNENYCTVEAFNLTLSNSQLSDFWIEHNFLDCHQDLRKEDLFYRAADRIGTKNGHWDSTHWGFHKHIHIAEDFYKYMNEKNLI